MKHTILLIFVALMFVLSACADPVPAVTKEAYVTATSEPTQTIEPTATNTPAPTQTIEPTATSTPEPTQTAIPTATVVACGYTEARVYPECSDIKVRLSFEENPNPPFDGRYMDSETYEFSFVQTLFVPSIDHTGRADTAHVTVRIHSDNSTGWFNLPATEFGRESGTWLIDVTIDQNGFYHETNNTVVAKRFYAVLRYGDLVHIYHDTPNGTELHFLTVRNGYVTWLEPTTPRTAEVASFYKTFGVATVVQSDGTWPAIEGFMQYDYMNAIAPDDVEVSISGEEFVLNEVEIKSIGGEIYPR